jgi:hypothetical protein
MKKAAYQLVLYVTWKLEVGPYPLRGLSSEYVVWMLMSFRLM